jgi:hypothetical protein
VSRVVICSQLSWLNTLMSEDIHNFLLM